MPNEVVLPVFLVQSNLSVVLSCVYVQALSKLQSRPVVVPGLGVAVTMQFNLAKHSMYNVQLKVQGDARRRNAFYGRKDHN